MTEQQTADRFFAAVDSLPATKPRESDPSFTLEQHIASLFRDKTPEEVDELYRQWREK